MRGMTCLSLNRNVERRHSLLCRGRDSLDSRQLSQSSYTERRGGGKTVFDSFEDIPVRRHGTQPPGRADDSGLDPLGSQSVLPSRVVPFARPAWLPAL